MELRLLLRCAIQAKALREGRTGGGVGAGDAIKVLNCSCTGSKHWCPCLAFLI